MFVFVGNQHGLDFAQRTYLRLAGAGRIDRMHDVLEFHWLVQSREC